MFINFFGEPWSDLVKTDAGSFESVKSLKTYSLSMLDFAWSKQEK